MKLLASVLWSMLNQGVRFFCRLGLIPTRKLPVRTIGIGNVQAGGAGKTPLTIRLAQDAVAQGMNVAILLRGYKGDWEKYGGVILPGETGVDPECSGDEAALIHERVPEAWIGVGADRFRSFKKLSMEFSKIGKRLDLVILDDAYQHWGIRCDRYVVAVTETRFGDRFFRDRYSSIAPEDVVVLTKGSQFPREVIPSLKRIRVRYSVSPGKPDVRYRFIAAIADPKQAQESLRQAGYSILQATIFPDHYLFSFYEVERFISEAMASGLRILLTGKDGVKWKALGVNLGLVEIVEPEIEFLGGGEFWSELFSSASS